MHYHKSCEWSVYDEMNDDMNLRMRMCNNFRKNTRVALSLCLKRLCVICARKRVLIFTLIMFTEPTLRFQSVELMDGQMWLQFRSNHYCFNKQTSFVNNSDSIP